MNNGNYQPLTDDLDENNPPREDSDSDAETLLNHFDIAKLNIKAGDILVLRTDVYLTAEQADGIRAQIDAIMDRAGHTGVPVMLLDKGMELSVLRTENKGGAGTSLNTTAL